VSGWLDFDEVERWAAEARARDAADARMRERWLRRQAEEEAAFAGLLVDLAERGVAVIVTTSGGRHHVGRVEAVGTDFAALATTGARTTLVSSAAVAAVRLAWGDAGQRRSSVPASVAAGRSHIGPAAHTADDSRYRRVTVTMADVIGHAVALRPRVQVFSASACVGGELRAFGTDVVTVHTDGDARGLAYVRLASVSELSFLDSG
jgi:hypothetical protein